MKPSLQLKLSQQLALTPQLQQSIRLLQLSTLELNQELEQILAENPLLERLDDPLAECARIAPNGSLDRAPGAADADADAPPPERRERADDAGGAGDGGGGDAPPDEGGYGEHGLEWGGEGRGGRADGDDDEREFPQVSTQGETLHDHLLAQLAGTGCSRRDRALVTLLVDELDADGYLRSSLEEVAQALPPELEIEPEELSAALRLLQSFDPPGVGARSIPECLLSAPARSRSACCCSSGRCRPSGARPSPRRSSPARSCTSTSSCSPRATSPGSSACCAATTTSCAPPRR